ncbi:protein-methionine-sulfoxide reductase heme-binding subunit MsrQ [Rhizosaccharibacter radicis]|uniref:Protein-methionine-sulfoxide reductase heme-binding subunit MsrQ n=1 Tax=Rhizosaccharibacter radicis TaxID=2782605 RepID=A0ABT1VUL7_9PROT|nr:protein-methionine-sulfoxide reductase heme-binding subunit MsrQ [Acetobacteraceae bacterium KSS12]
MTTHPAGPDAGIPGGVSRGGVAKAAKRGRSGGLFASRWWLPALYVAGFVPAGWFFFLGATNHLGADPVRTFEHVLGLWALRFVILALLVTPVRDLARINLLRFRRALGLLAFWYALMHLLVYAILDRGLRWHVILQDITKRPFLIIGMATFVLLLVLACTSNRFSIRRLKRNWVRLHRLAYLAAALAAWHFIMSVKSWPPQPVLYGTIVAVLLAYRVVRPFRHRIAGGPSTARS